VGVNVGYFQEKELDTRQSR